MIRTESEYRATKARIEQGREVAACQQAQLVAEGLTAEEIERVMAPLLSFQMQYVEEVEWYERVKAGDLASIQNLTHIGQVLVGLRIAGGLSQKDLAERLGVSDAVVSRDERNEYHGITVERAQRILEALGAHAILTPVAPFNRSMKPRELVAP